MTKLNRDTIEKILTLTITGMGLIALLSYTFWHTGGLLSRFIEPGFLGYVCALGAETIIVVMSWKLAKDKNQLSGFLGFALISALVVSAIANYYEGFATYHGQELSAVTFWAEFDVIQFVVSILARSLISLLVFAVTDILSSDIGRVAYVPKRIVNVKPPTDITPPPKVTKPVKLSKIAGKPSIAQQMRTDGKPVSQIASELDVTPKTVYRWTENGKVK